MTTFLKKNQIRVLLLAPLLGIGVRSFCQGLPQGAINGLFSVSVDKQVFFSQGNLQYQASTGTWRFAEHQWDFVGGYYPDVDFGNVYEINDQGQTFKCANEDISETYEGWIDLFGWGTSGFDHGAVCYQPYSTQNEYWCYYAYGASIWNLDDNNGMADWGYNAISNGGNVGNIWRTPSSGEWWYVFQLRNTPSGIRYAKAQVNDVYGVVLVPDNWSEETFFLDSVNIREAAYTTNVISAEEWGILESAGAVFFPAAGCRNRINLRAIDGYYWSQTPYEEQRSHFMYFRKTMLDPINFYPRQHGMSVRLICSPNVLGVNETPDNGVMVYPIPAKDIIVIKSDVAVGRCEIYNMVGQLVYEELNCQKEMKVSVGDLSSGTYVVRLISDGNVCMKKFIVQ